MLRRSLNPDHLSPSSSLIPGPSLEDSETIPDSARDFEHHALAASDIDEPSTTGIADAVFDNPGPDSDSELGAVEDPADVPLQVSGESQEAPDLSSLTRDPVGEEYGRSLLNSCSDSDVSLPLPKDGEPIAGWHTPVRSRVLKDPWHVFNMLNTPRAHGARIIFAHALRDAIFIPDKGDKENISRYLSALSPPRSWEMAVRTTPKWVWRHCKRLIPPPELLYPQVAGVFQTYGPIKDAKTGQPLFNAAAWQTAKNILSLIQNGYLSDPPGVALYYTIGIDAKAGNLPVYRCVRGTNWTEGGVHRHLRPKLPTSGASVQHMLCCLYEFILRHNLLVSPGVAYRNSRTDRRPVHVIARWEPSTALGDRFAVITISGSPTTSKKCCY